MGRIASLGLFILLLGSQLGVLGAEPDPPAPTLEVREHAFGSGVAERRLTGRAESFSEGTRVVFWTRVVGGRKGDRIYHVWMREGREVVSVGLSIGGPHWRTYSRKWMHPGAGGTWRVEARDAQGRVLASGEFRCVAGPGQPQSHPKSTP